MSKFYVYSEQRGQKLTRYYVDTRIVQEFADQQFRPETMIYTGVIVEADTPKEADKVFHTFSGNIISADEPPCLTKKRQEFEAKINVSKSQLKDLSQIKKHKKVVAVEAYAQKISTEILSLNNLIAQMAFIAHETMKDGAVLHKHEIYKRLKKMFIEQLNACRYDDRPT